MDAPATIRIQSGRLDQLIIGCMELLCRGYVEPRIGNLPLWDRAVGPVVEQLVVDAGVPAIPVTAVDVARMLGVLRPEPRAIAANPAVGGSGRRRRKKVARVR